MGARRQGAGRERCIYNNTRIIEPSWRTLNSVRNNPQQVLVSLYNLVNFKNGLLPPKYFPLISLFYSGGLTVRAILETMDDHNVDSFISLSSPQMGQYGGI